MRFMYSKTLTYFDALGESAFIKVKEIITLFIISAATLRRRR